MESEKDVKENIINFAKVKGRYGRKISEEEINALFMGLLKIVKKSAEEASQQLKEECDAASENFRSCLIELNATQMDLKKEREEKESLMMKLEMQQQQICRLLRKWSAKNKREQNRAE